ncbi:MAG: hypothetical protein RL091_3084 [Verrucomicrobiota bacterium]|jgi:hypothetical protein
MKGVLMMWGIDARISFGASKPALLKPHSRHWRSTSANTRVQSEPKRLPRTVGACTLGFFISLR